MSGRPNKCDLDTFIDAYERLAEQGKCDTPGGMEYTRVLALWEAAGFPEPPDLFIIRWANEPPPPPPHWTWQAVGPGIQLVLFPDAQSATDAGA